MTQVTGRSGGAALAETTAAAIEMRGLRCRYGTYEAVRGVDLHVRRGEIFALPGRSWRSSLACCCASPPRWPRH